MAKRPAKSVVSVALLRNIAAGTEGNWYRVSQEEAKQHESLIEVNTADIAEGKAAARLSEAGKQYLANVENPINSESAGKPMYGIIQAKVTIPASKRGNRKGAGAPTQYPFETMNVGDTFFVPDSAKKGNAAKHLGSTVSQQNMHYREETSETKQVTRTKRGPGNKAEIGPDGNKVKETVTVPVYKPTRKYVVRAVKKGDVLGEWTVPDDGALVAREA